MFPMSPLKFYFLIMTMLDCYWSFAWMIIFEDSMLKHYIFLKTDYSFHVILPHPIFHCWSPDRLDNWSHNPGYIGNEGRSTPPCSTNPGHQSNFWSLVFHRHFQSRTARGMLRILCFSSSSLDPSGELRCWHPGEGRVLPEGCRDS